MMDLATLFVGIFLAVFVFTFAKVVTQTVAIWRRTKRVADFYLVMIWVETLLNLAFAVTIFLFLDRDGYGNNIIPGGYAHCQSHPPTR